MNDLTPDWIGSHARRRPDATAIIEWSPEGVERRLNWREVDQIVSRLASQWRACLDHAGVVMLPGGNDAMTLMAFHAALKAGMTVFPLPSTCTATEFAACAGRAGAVAVVRREGDVDAVMECRLLALDVGSDALMRSTVAMSSDSADECSIDGAAVLLQSSGTTGQPKVIRRDIHALSAVGRQCIEAIGMTAEDRMLVVVPITHSYGIDHAVMAWAMAGFMVELHERFDVQSTRRSIMEGGVTLMPATPFLLDALSQGEPVPREAHRLRQVYSAGGPLPLRVAETFASCWSLAVGQIYGATEFGSVTFNDPTIAPYDPTSAGRAMTGVQLRITKVEGDDGHATDDARQGSLHLAAPSMMTGLIEAERSLDEHGFIETGDLARIDEHGRLYVTGRTRLLIDVGGLKVNPIEVEQVLLMHPSVRETAVIAMPMSDTVQRVKAIVVWRGASGDLDGLRLHLRQHLSSYKLPRVIEVRDSLPRSMAGKLLRHQLK